MLAARMHEYHKPLVLEDIKVPEILPEQVLVRVGGSGMCRSDVQLIDGYFSEGLKMNFPITPGYEIAGLVAEIGDRAPQTAQLAIGDQVVVATGWGDGICRQCRVGNEQICEHGSWPGFGPPGGYAEFIAVQYAKLLSAGATVVVFARNDEKLAIAKQRGADVAINTRGKSLADLHDELFRLTGKRKLDAAIDCVGAPETIQTGIGLLATAGVFVSVGLMGNKIDIPLFPFTSGELTYHGSFWANYSDLQEVLALAQKGKIQHSIKRVRFQDINENLELLRAGDIIGRAVIVFDIDGGASGASGTKSRS